MLTIGKILLNLETKLSRLEAANEKLIEAFEQNNDVEGAEQFQLTLDEESEVIDGVINRLSQLKVLKAELECRRWEGERRPNESIETRVTEMQEQMRLIHTQQTTGMSLQSYGPLKPPQLEIAPFSGDILKWQEFWDAFEASVHQASYAPVDKLNYRTVGNFRGVLIFVDFVGPMQTTKNSLKICIDPRKYNFLGLKTTNLSLFHIMHIAMLCSYIAP